MIKIQDSLVREVSKKAKLSRRKRINYNFHKEFTDPIQRLINALEPGTYIRPHKHEKPDKREVFLILKGRVLAVEFDDRGSVTDHIILDPKRGDFGVEFPPGVWHTFLALEEGSALYELKDGPYIESSDKGFAKWAPAERSPEAPEFNRKILRGLGLA